MRAYLGIDWSNREAVAAVAGEAGRPRRIKGARPTMESVKDLVARARAETHAEEVHVIIESGAESWVRRFHHAGAVVHVVDSKQARRFSESMGSSGAKDDGRDAEILVHIGRTPSHLPEAWQPPSDKVEKLLAARRDQRMSQRTRAVQRLRQELQNGMPLVNEAIRDFEAQWVRALLTVAPTAWHAARLTRVKFEAVMSRAHASTVERVWTALRQAECPWLGEDMAELDALQVRHQLKLLAMFDEQIAVLDKHIEAALADEGELCMSMNGIGVQLASSIITFGFGGEVPADRDAASIRMGASPVFVGSAKRRDGKPKGAAVMRRAAPPRARAATYLIGRLLTQHLRWAKAMFAHYRSHGQGAAGAYRRIARAGLRILTAMMRTNTPYDDARYVAALKANGVPWAMAL